MYTNSFNPSPFTTLYVSICACALCNSESQKKSAKCYNFKEDDRALPLLKLLLYAGPCHTSYPHSGTIVGCPIGSFKTHILT